MKPGWARPRRPPGSLHHGRVTTIGTVRVTALLIAALISATVASCATPNPSPAPRRSASTATTAPTSLPLSVPTTYEQVCNFEGSVCSNNGEFGPYGSFPSAFDRPLTLPSIAPGQACPVSAGSLVNTVAFGGIALGSGPARPMVFATLGSVHPAQDIPFESPRDGWYGLKTLWFVAPSYQGPVLVRGARIDTEGAMAFGESPALGELIIPPGPTLNEASDGYRTAPGGTYVHDSGCYAWQVDGIGFSTHIVFSATTV